MRRLLVILMFVLIGGSRPAEAVFVQATVAAVRLDPQTIQLQVANIGVFAQGNLYELFGVPLMSPFGNPVYVGAYGNPVSMLMGDFGNPVGYEGDVHGLGPGETQGFGLDYAVDVLSPPWNDVADLDFHAGQDYFYEYSLPDGSVFREMAGRVEGDLHFLGQLPAGVGDRTELLITPEPRSVYLLTTAILLLGLLVRPARRRSTQ